MNSTSAAENLQVIRTLMERATLYRRALAPIMVLAGCAGLLAAAAGWLVKIESVAAFGIYWMAVGVIVLGIAYFMTRRQAIKEGEPFWSPPTRRVTAALMAPLLAGLVIGVVIAFGLGAGQSGVWRLLPVWMLFYGCALHAAGFFTPRGVRGLGIVFVLGGCALFGALNWCGCALAPIYAHGVMGAFFGGLHLAFGLYLRFTDKDGNAA
jgi:hypothetical protein